MIGDYLSKPLQGKLFKKFKDLIMGNAVVPPPKMVAGRSVLKAQFFQCVNTDSTAEAKDEPQRCGSSIPTKEEAKDGPQRRGQRVWSSIPDDVIDSDDVSADDARILKIQRVPSDDRVSSDVRSILKYATAKYEPTLARLTKYDVTVGKKVSMIDLNRVFSSLSSSQPAQPIQDVAILNNGSPIKTKRGFTCMNLRSSKQCAILKEFRRDRCDLSELSEKKTARSTHAVDCGLSACHG
jgi:hypothetical protein